MFYLFLTFLLLHFISDRVTFPIEYEDDQCISHSGVQGKCVPINYCPSLSLKCLHPIEQNCAKICWWDHEEPIVCCPTLNTESFVELTTTPKETHETITSSPIETTTMKENESTELTEKINCGITKDFSVSYIVGGDEVRTNFEWPWMVALFTKTEELNSSSLNNYTHFCGGSIISENYILTAAHCLKSFKKVSDLFVGIGSTSLNETIKIPVKQMINHPNYIPSKSYYDIALLITSTSINFTDTIRPICLFDASLFNLFTKDVAVAGWGRQSVKGPTSPRLKEAHLKMVPNQLCNQSYSQLKSSSIPQGIRSDQLCAGSKLGDKDTCEGDSGGPLTIEVPPSSNWFGKGVHYLIGLTSFGRGCADPNYPGVYTRISDYAPWIKEQLKSQF